MRSNKKAIFLAGLFLGLSLLAVILCWFWLYKPTVPDIKSDIKLNSCVDENAEIVIKDLILKEVEKHKGLEVLINAGEGKILNSTDKIECKNISCILNDNSEKVADLQANNAIIHKPTKNVFLAGSTVGHAYDITISGQDISYNYSSHMLSTDCEINYSHKFFYLVAKKSYVDLKANKIVMSGGVTSEFFNRPATRSSVLNSSTGNSNTD